MEPAFFAKKRFTRRFGNVEGRKGAEREGAKYGGTAMDWDRLIRQLEHILKTEFRLKQVARSEWNRWGEARDLPPTASRERDGELLFPIRLSGDRVDVLAASPAGMTETERRLVDMMLETARQSLPGRKTGHDALKAGIRDWIEEHIAGGEPEDGDPPAHLASHPVLFQEKVPFLIVGDPVHDGEFAGGGLQKLLESFFDGDVLLVPLHDKEWLVLAGRSLLEPGDEADGEESLEERLASLCEGLHSVMLNEGEGEFHVTVHYPIVPAKSLPVTVARMREAVAIGRSNRANRYVHLPWELYLDQLLSPLSRADKIRFIEQVFKRKEPMLDDETIQTLETFFELNCNVSETAKKLYIHRNTLLYRLDKFRQESGLDVRNFNQAVHVKIALQLYKVTKRD
jgi:hypothetical protein